MLEITSPDLAFAFNPIIIKVSSTTSVTEFKFTANGHTITRPAVNGAAYFYVQAIAQSMFNRRDFVGATLQDTVLMKPMDFSITSGTESASGSMDVLWGAMQFGETYTQNKTLTWFRGLPFTVPLYLKGAKLLQYRIDRGDLQDGAELDAGKWNIDPETLSGSNEAQTLYLYVAGDEGGDTGIFDYTFDYTFRPFARDSVFITVNIKDCTQGVYLRWINKHGEYCYYLFDEGAASNAVQNGGVNLNEFVRDLGFQSEGHNPGSNRNSEKNIQASVKLSAPLVDKTTFDMLEGLPESMIVDLYMGLDETGAERWVGVNITPGTFTRSKSILQDFECTMLYPTTFNQSL